jgi:hypothetical protein
MKRIADVVASVDLGISVISSGGFHGFVCSEIVNYFLIFCFMAPRVYVGYPESKCRWAIEKTKNLFSNILYCHLMYISYTP